MSAGGIVSMHHLTGSCLHLRSQNMAKQNKMDLSAEVERGEVEKKTRSHLHENTTLEYLFDTLNNLLCSLWSDEMGEQRTVQVNKVNVTKYVVRPGSPPGPLCFPAASIQSCA